MAKPVATWFILATLALMTTSAQFIGEYVASTSSVSIRANFSDGFLTWVFEPLDGSELTIRTGARLVGGPDSYVVDYSDFGRFQRLINNAFPQVQLQPGDLTVLLSYDEVFFKTLFGGKEVFFIRHALPLVPGTYLYYEGERFVRLTVITLFPGNSISVFITFRCEHGRSQGHRFSDLRASEITNIQYSGDAANALYAGFIRDVTATCPGFDLPTEGFLSFFVLSATPYTVYLHLGGQRTKTFALDKIE
ncbi:hypothetical protein FOZ60_010322 [Perkinsus olseni]|uniref:Uncharacterized protein n=1 Tax=Perkinsus olseni TaxID=32597 RepID=A0A7J6PBV1_PEROL|nr:hypothetical protein FOZ60_010322 [Perkinsus olseni]